jgi:hypothetical protein
LVILDDAGARKHDAARDSWAVARRGAANLNRFREGLRLALPSAALNQAAIIDFFRT